MRFAALGEVADGRLKSCGGQAKPVRGKMGVALRETVCGAGRACGDAGAGEGNRTLVFSLEGFLQVAKKYYFTII